VQSLLAGCVGRSAVAAFGVVVGAKVMLQFDAWLGRGGERTRSSRRVVGQNVAKPGNARPQTARDEYISAGAASSAKKPAASEDDIDI
jgi:hypothetical protein